jgi:hypothetical protein
MINSKLKGTKITKQIELKKFRLLFFFSLPARLTLEDSLYICKDNWRNTKHGRQTRRGRTATTDDDDDS